MSRPLDAQYYLLNDGTEIPAVGMGCWMGGVGGGQRVYDMCKKALQNGYRHFDTAAGYGNEEEVGRAIRDSGIPRKDIFITTKLANSDHHRVLEAFEESLKKLDCEYVNLYLLHWPQGQHPGGKSMLSPDESPTFVETYKEMEKLLHSGKVKSIGVSNFSIKTLTTLLAQTTIIPATNQVELHPCLPQTDLKDFCESRNIILTAYSPLGRSNTLLEHPTIVDVARRLGASPAQVILSWGVQRGTVVIPKSEDNARMIENIKIIELPVDDVALINKIHTEPGMHRSLLKYHTIVEGTAMGWTYEWLGWNMTNGGFVVPSK